MSAASLHKLRPAPDQIIVGLDPCGTGIVETIITRAGDVLPSRPHGGMGRAAVEGLTKIIHRDHGDRVIFALESSTEGWTVAEIIRRLGYPCEVMQPKFIKGLPGTPIKNDHRDSKKIAVAYQSGDYEPARQVGGTIMALRKLVAQREEYIKRKTGQLSQRHAIAVVGQPYGSQTSVPEGHLAEDDDAVSEAFDAALTLASETANHYAVQISRIDNVIHKLIDGDDDLHHAFRAMRALPSAGSTAAAAMIALLGEPMGFSGREKVKGYLRFHPFQLASGDKDYRTVMEQHGFREAAERILSYTAQGYGQENPGSVPEKIVGFSPEVSTVARQEAERLHDHYWRQRHRQKHTLNTIQRTVGHEMVVAGWRLWVASRLYRESREAA